MYSVVYLDHHTILAFLSEICKLLVSHSALPQLLSRFQLSLPMQQGQALNQGLLLKLPAILPPVFPLWPRWSLKQVQDTVAPLCPEFLRDLFETSNSNIIWL